MPPDSPSKSGATAAKNKSPTLPERVAQIYYAHGLFCSSYPISVIVGALTIAILCCYPLLNIPLPGNMPLQVPWSKNESSLNDAKWDMPYPWAKIPPQCFVQQIVIRTAVFPWSENLMLTDAFRGPLYEAFKILEIVRNHQDETSKKTLGHLCLHVENVKQKSQGKKDVMPEYNCLLLSPANLWQNNAQNYAIDTNILGTIYNFQNLQKGKISLAEVLFGMNLKDTGIKRYPIRNRLRIIQYAITIVLKEYDPSFISTLVTKLQHFYPLYQNNLNQSDLLKSDNEVLHIYYPGEFNYYEFIPLIVAFVLFFLYIYFSVRKIELVKSKLGMAIAAVASVMLCLSMSVGLCFFFGLTLSLQGKEVFPYLIILIGLENVLVLTKSVVSTPPHLDVKIRVAQGLSKEGWSITKNLLVELTILTIGFFTFIPAIQEFCIFAIVGLISDFFLQMLFFSTVLAIDIRRMELLQRHVPFQNSFNNFFDKTYPPVQQKIGLNRSKSHPRLSGAHTNIVASQTHSVEKKIPKRLRLVHIWARTRFFQRGFMIWMVVWISMLVYDSGIIENFVDLYQTNGTKQGLVNSSDSDVVIPAHISAVFDETRSAGAAKTTENKKEKNIANENILNILPTLTTSSHYAEVKYPADNGTEDLSKLRHSEYSYLRKLSTFHWPAVFRSYNISLRGRYITLLSPIRISHVVRPEIAINLRNPEEKPVKHFQWSALAAALDPLDFSDVDVPSKEGHWAEHMTPYYPTSPMEIMFTTILCVISTVVLAYATVVLYRCICSRNYAEWRASWTSEKIEEPSTQVVMEAVPTVLDGHIQHIECLASDGSRVVSSCLSGQLKIWDAQTAEPLKTINRTLYFGDQQHNLTTQQDMELDENLPSDYESGSPPSRDEHTGTMGYTRFNLPTLQQKIYCNFSNLRADFNTNNFVFKSGSKKPSFDFGPQFSHFFLNSDGGNMNIHNRKKNETANWVFQNSVCDRNSVDMHGNDKVPLLELDSMNSVKQLKRTVVPQSRVPPIWCLDYVDNLIAIGCANGRIEFWEGTTGNLKCLFDDGSGIGVTSLKVIANRVVAAKLNGCLEFLQLESYTQGRQIDWSFTSAYRRTHVRTGSAGSLGDCRDVQMSNTEDLRCIRLNVTKAHQQPISVLEAEGGRVLTGSQDHTLKVFRLEDQAALYTLHGHCGPITCLFIDRITPMMSGSGSQDGLLCVWDLLTGTCMYSIQAHDGSITSLTYSASYVISLGADERLCVWERFQGHLLNTIQVSQTYANSMVMLTQCLLVTARQGSLTVWDVRTGETVRKVTLGNQDSCIFVKQVLLLPDAQSLVCDYANQLRIVRFPMVHDKFD